MAYDVALELQSRGRQVGGIVLLDSYMQLEVIDWSEEDYLNDAVLYIEQNHAEFLDDEIKDAALQKIVAYRRYLNARSESGFIDCPIFQIEANDEITSFGNKISRNAWKDMTAHYEVFKGFGSHMDMLKQPNLSENAQLTCRIFKHLIEKVEV
jgi:hybrid polyketide synthase/nonribosomal peptide synthetase FtdB